MSNDTNTIKFQEVIFEHGQVIKHKNMFHEVPDGPGWPDRLAKHLSECYSLNYEVEDFGEGYIMYSERYGGPSIELIPV